ncbi:hypothetical protein ACRAWD_02425 [Caulobacter segnis]
MWSAVTHLQAVADTPELRAAYAAGQARLVENHLQVSAEPGPLRSAGRTRPRPPASRTGLMRIAPPSNI